MFSRSTHNNQITLGVDYEVQSSDDRSPAMPLDLYSITTNKLNDPERWDVYGVVKDIRQRLWDDNDLEAVAVIDYLTDRVNKEDGK